jgi:hypothetical protein
MAHVQTKYAGMWKPQDLAVDKISPQKVFIDNTDAVDNFAKITMQKMHTPVRTLDELKAIDTSDTAIFTNGTLIVVANSGLYQFDRTSILNENSTWSVVIPTKGGGRWLSVVLSTRMTASYDDVGTSEQLDTKLTNIITSMQPHSVRHVIFSITTNITPFGGGNVHMMINKTSDSYATIIASRYGPDVIRYVTRSLFEGKWGRWAIVPILDVDGRIPVSMLPEAYVAANTLAEAEVV